MKTRSILTTGAALALTATLGLAPGAAEASTPKGTTSLAEVLTSDGNRFDRNSRDYDIVTEAVLAVVGAKTDSPVGLLADGTVPLTAFIPNDVSFRRLAYDLTGQWIRSERRIFNTLVDAVGVDAIEQVLLYHVVPGATITSSQALKADGVDLTTAQGATFEVDVVFKRLGVVRLRDQDKDDVDPFLNPWALDINRGNQQIAHGIVFVLRPIDLP
ncbi:fasciclin domain-containing protein [Nocardioides sp. GY 10113]|uniref:fasciclin domain-containing protein n=1 Tax=Nocardioides sp. GY 10113 TaxID=2569761 RepID=UPI0010A843B7|nr:fasciclin domain-containing protein [Nocardioides sp. GY 10113]TIC88874.1 fasciclin domain-containing protein [Nocardioides sp. GY 10113]